MKSLKIRTLLAAAFALSAVPAVLAETPFDSTYDLVSILGLTGAEYTGSAGYQSSSINYAFDSGNAFGDSNLVTGVSTNNGQDVWWYNAASGLTTQLGLTGAAYTGSAGYQVSGISSAFDSGNAFGTSQRITGVNSYNGQDSWRYDVGTGVTTQLGFTGGAYTGSAGYQGSGISFAFNSGNAFGTSFRVVGVNTVNGFDAWRYNATTGTTTQLGFTGGVYTGSAGYQSSNIEHAFDSGNAFGASARITGVNTNNGQNVWRYNATTGTTSLLGLTGAGYTGSAGYQVSGISFGFDSGNAFGVSNRITGVNTVNGQNTWRYEAVSGFTTQLGLTGAAYVGSAGYQVSNLYSAFDSGNAFGLSLRFIGVNTDNGRDAWRYNAATGITTQLGFAGAGYTGSTGYEFSEISHSFDSGNAFGRSLRVIGVNTNNGQDAWRYSAASGLTTQLGFTGAGYTGSAGFQASGISFGFDSGNAFGNSQRITGVNTYNGQDVWRYHAASGTTTQLGLTGSANTGSAGYQASGLNSAFDSGRAFGYSSRFIGVNALNGQDAWVFDGIATTGVLLSQNASNGRAFSNWFATTSDGSVGWGTYEKYAGETLLGYRAFFWSESHGVNDLEHWIEGGLPAYGITGVSQINKVLANGDLLVTGSTAAGGQAVALLKMTSNLYWDTNGTTLGYGNTGGVWDTNSTNWGSWAGTGNTGKMVSGRIANFGADGEYLSRPTVAYTVQVSGEQSVNGLRFTNYDSDITLSNGGGGAIRLTGSNFVSTDNQVYVEGLSTATIGVAFVGESSLHKTGNGELVLTAANTYEGNTYVQSGTLRLGNGGATGSLSFGINSGPLVYLNSGTQLIFDRSDDFVFRNTIVSDGNESSWVVKRGANRVALADMYNPPNLRVEGGVLELRNGSMFDDSTSKQMVVESGAALVFNHSHTLILGSGESFTHPDHDTLVTWKISGAGRVEKQAENTLIFSGNNTYAGGTTVQDGVLRAGHISAFGTGAVTVNGGTLDLNGYDVANTITLSGGTLLGAQNRTATLAATSGTTVVSSNVGGAVTVATGAAVKLAEGVTVAGGVTVNSGGVVNGTGNAGNLVLNAGGSVAPGNSPGILNANNVTWNGGAIYNWELNNTVGVAGTAFDKLIASGTIDIQATGVQKFVINIIGLDATNAAGVVQAWDSLADYSWMIASAEGGVTNYDASKFFLNFDGFTNNNEWVAGRGFSLELSADGKAIMLKYAAGGAIPEPSTYGLLGAGALAATAIVRRRRKRAGLAKVA